MDWELITKHLISGYIPVFAAVALYFLLVQIRRKQPLGHIAVSFVFCFYLVGTLTMAGIWFLGPFSPRVELVPFADMIKSPLYTMLNVLLFLPLGFFLPILYKKVDRIEKAALIGFLLSLAVEILQMFGSGTSDVNDLITNTIGACVGFCIANGLRRIIPESKLKAIQISGVWCYREIAFFCMICLVMMITVQPGIYRFLFSSGMTGGEISVWR